MLGDFSGEQSTRKKNPEGHTYKPLQTATIVTIHHGNNTEVQMPDTLSTKQSKKSSSTQNEYWPPYKILYNRK